MEKSSMNSPQQIEEKSKQTESIVERSVEQRPESIPPDKFVATNAQADDDELSKVEDEIQISKTEVKEENQVVPHKSTISRKRRRRRQPKYDAKEQRLLGRRALCKRIEDIAPHMLKTVKLRVLGRYLESTRGMNESDLTARIIKDARKISEEKRVLSTLNSIDPDVNRRNLKEIIVYAVLLQEETHSLEESRLAEKVIEYEIDLIKQAKNLDFFDQKKHDAMRWHNYDTYRIVLEAAWRNNEDVSPDEAALLRVLRDKLNVSREEHRLIGAYIKRFPKHNCTLHTNDEIHDARKELQREAILWSFRDENNRTIDVIPSEVVFVLRKHIMELELQQKNYERILQHDSIRLSDLREVIQRKDMDRYGKKPELINRLVNSDVKPSEVLDELERSKLSDMCRLVGIKSSGNKPDLVHRLVDFYDDLTFEEIVTLDKREEWYNNYELLATRSYSDLRAKKLISKDLEIEHQFEQATDFLFEAKLKVSIDKKQKITKADGRIPLDQNFVILWDCKSVEGEVNLQDHLEVQFDSYLRKEREKAFQPLAFLVIAPAFTHHSLKLAFQYKAKTNWDIALVEAEALKHLAELWSATEPKKSFPIRLLNRTELIDKERVEFLLSLA